MRDVALLMQKPLQQTVLLHLCHLRPTEPIHQPVPGKTVASAACCAPISVRYVCSRCVISG